MQINFGLTADDYASYRAGFPESLFDRLQRTYGLGRAGQTLVDLGCGTGALGRGFAQRGCQVIGVDPAEAMLAQARKLDQAAGVSADYRPARAEATGLPDGWAEVVSAGQCWHWFERAQAAVEAARILHPGGRIVIAHYDWLPLTGNLVEATERLIQAYNPAWTMGGGNGIYPAWLTDLGEAGFRQIESFSYDEPAVYTPQAWRGRIRASAGVGASLPPERVAAFDRDLADLLARRFPGDRLAVPHRVFVATGLAVQ